MYANDEELRKFFGFMVWPKYKLPAEKIRKNILESLQLFSWKERYNNIRREFTKEFEELRFNLERSRLPSSIRDILLDEFAFLASSLSILSRLKNTFKLLKQFNIPLIDLGEIAPEKWKSHIKHIKKAIDIIRYVATFMPFSLQFEFEISEKLITGVSIFLIDPQRHANALTK